MRHRTLFVLAVAIAMGGRLVGHLSAQTIQAPFDDTYSFTDLGSPPNVPDNLGGLNFALGNPNTLIIGGAANTATAELYAIGVTRDSSGHITGFSGAASDIASAPFQDGGLAYGPGNVLFQSEYPVNRLGELKPGSVSPDAIIDLNSLGVGSSQGAVNFVPGGFGGAGHMKLVSWPGGNWYDATLAPTGSGTYSIATLTDKPASYLAGSGPEGFFYIPRLSPHFSAHSMLVSEYSSGSIGAYQVDSNGDPIVSSRQTFMNGLTGAEGAVFDPISGDYLFSTFSGGNHVLAIHGFIQSLPGDYNLDGAVNAADYVIWRKGLGTTFSDSDYDLWRANYGKTTGGGNAAQRQSSALPEPKGSLLAIFAGVGVAFAVIFRPRRNACYS